MDSATKDSRMSMMRLKKYWYMFVCLKAPFLFPHGGKIRTVECGFNSIKMENDNYKLSADYIFESSPLPVSMCSKLGRYTFKMSTIADLETLFDSNS